MSDTLIINEIYLSLQGESTFAGLPCIFVRLTACNLRCSYCDTAYAFREGQEKSLADVCAEVIRLAEPFDPVRSAESRVRSAKSCAWRIRFPLPVNRHSTLDTPSETLDSVGRLPLVELTGGEPLLQKNCL